MYTVLKMCVKFLVSFNGAEFPMRNQRRNANSPNTVNCTVRKYLTAREIEKPMDYARKHSRYGHRDSTMILVAYRHGLRASEICDLQWHQVELDQGRMHVRRAKNGTPSVHPIRGDENRALRKLRRESPTEASYVFVTERGGPMSTIGFHHLIQRLGKAARMPFSLHPHMLRHACGYKLANDGQIEQAIEAIQAMLAAQAGEAVKVIEGTAEPAALPAPNGPSPEAALEATLEPAKRKPNRLMMEVDTAIGPQERKPRKRVPSPAST